MITAFIILTVVFAMFPFVLWFIRNALRVFFNWETYGFNKFLFYSIPVCLTIAVTLIIIFFTVIVK